MQVAIDGPASAGKSTVAKIVARKLSFIYIDTGAMYRACTLMAKNHGVDYGDQAGILALIKPNSIQFENKAGQQHVIVEGQDASLAIRTPEITANVSQVSALPEIRKKMVSLQRSMAGSMNVIMDGRDIGTTVLPQADVKIFLVASIAARAKRRELDYADKGIHEDYDTIYQDIKLRDYKDSHRKVSPLRQAPDAVRIDTSNLNIDQVVAAILKVISEKQKKAAKK